MVMISIAGSTVVIFMICSVASVGPAVGVCGVLAAAGRSISAE
jgi:hypothetical protein